jgi:soluble P-type ATPase
VRSEAGFAIATLGTEGLAVSALHAADLVLKGSRDALDLLLHPSRLIASWRV